MPPRKLLARDIPSYITEIELERNHYVRLFNRLETAVRRHVEAKEGTGFTDDADDALHSAFKAVMKEAASGQRRADSSSEGES